MIRDKDMPYGTANAVSAKAVNGRIYVFGGWNQTVGGYMYATQIYAPSTNAWTTGSNAPEPIGGGDAIAPDDGRILLFGAANNHWNSTTVLAMGGRTGRGTASDNVLAYNPVTQAWSTLATMPDAVNSGGAAVAANGYVYCIGGSTDVWPSLGVVSSAIQRYDPATNTWEVSTWSLPTGVAGFGCASDSYGRAFVAGGYDGASTSSAICMVNPADIEWDVMRITSPADGSVVSGEVFVTVSVQNAWYGITTVDLYVDGDRLRTNYAGWSGAVTFSWDTSSLPDKSTHVPFARGFMSTGRVLDNTVTVTVWKQSLANHVAAVEQALASLQADVDSLQTSLAALDA